MKRTAVPLTLIVSLLITAIAGAQLILLAKGNIMIGIVKPAINVVTPANTTYSTNALSLRVKFITITTGLFDGGPRYENTRSFTYTLDEQEPENIPITKFNVGQNPGADVFFEGEDVLKGLAEGLHNLTVRVVFKYSSFNPSDPSLFYAESESIVCFRIDTVPQNISILTPENTSYTFGVPLQAFIDEPASWVGYSLDGQENVTINGNTTLPGLVSGLHNITVYAADAFGNIDASKTILFSVADPFPVAPVAIAIVVITAVAAGLLLYLRRRKRQVRVVEVG